jgi:hypothetical protein
LAFCQRRNGIKSFNIGETCGKNNALDCVEATTGMEMRRRSSSIECVSDNALTWLFVGLSLIAVVAGLLSQIVN